MAFYLATPGYWVTVWQGEMEGDGRPARVLYTYDGSLVGRDGGAYSVIAVFDESEIRRLYDGEAYNCRPPVHIICEDVTGDEKHETLPVGEGLWTDLVTLATAEPDFNARVEELFDVTCAGLGLEFRAYNQKKAAYQTKRLERNERRAENQRIAAAKARLAGIRQDMVNLMLWCACVSQPAYEALDEMVRADNPVGAE